MAMKMKAEECVDCGACAESCPMKAIYPGGEKYELGGATHDALSDHYYIVPEKCVECVDSGAPRCVANCPVGCIIKDPARQETKEQLLDKKKKLLGN